MKRLLKKIVKNADGRISELDQFLEVNPPLLTPSPMRQDRARLMWKSTWEWIRRAENVVGHFDRGREDGGPGVMGMFAPWAEIDGCAIATILPRCDEKMVRLCNTGFAFLIRPTKPDVEKSLWDDPVSAWSAMSDAAEIAFCNVVQTAVAVRKTVAEALMPLRRMTTIQPDGLETRDLISVYSGSDDGQVLKKSTHWLTKAEVALRLGVSQRKVDRMAAKSGMLTKYKLGTSARSAVRFSAEEVDGFMRKAGN